MKNILLIFILLLVGNFAFAQNEVWVKRKDSNHIRKFNLPYKVSVAYKNDYLKFDSPVEHSLILQHVSKNGDTVYFSELNSNHIFALTINDIEYIRFKRTLLGCYIYIETIGISIAGSFLLPFSFNDKFFSAPIFTLIGCVSIFVLYNQLRNYNRTFNSDKYLIRELKHNQ